MRSLVCMCLLAASAAEAHGRGLERGDAPPRRLSDEPHAGRDEPPRRVSEPPRDEAPAKMKPLARDHAAPVTREPHEPRNDPPPSPEPRRAPPPPVAEAVREPVGSRPPAKPGEAFAADLDDERPPSRPSEATTRAK